MRYTLHFFSKICIYIYMHTHQQGTIASSMTNMYRVAGIQNVFDLQTSDSVCCPYTIYLNRFESYRFATYAPSTGGYHQCFQDLLNGKAAGVIGMDRILHFNMRKDAALRESYQVIPTPERFLVGSAFAGNPKPENIRLAKYYNAMWLQFELDNTAKLASIAQKYFQPLPNHNAYANEEKLNLILFIPAIAFLIIYPTSMIFHSLHWCDKCRDDFEEDDDDNEMKEASDNNKSIEIVNPMMNYRVNTNKTTTTMMSNNDDNKTHHHEQHHYHSAKGHNRPLYCDSPEIQNIHHKLDDVVKMLGQIDVMRKGRFQKLR